MTAPDPNKLSKGQHWMLKATADTRMPLSVQSLNAEQLDWLRDRCLAGEFIRRTMTEFELRYPDSTPLKLDALKKLWTFFNAVEIDNWRSSQKTFNDDSERVAFHIDEISDIARARLSLAENGLADSDVLRWLKELRCWIILQHHLHKQQITNNLTINLTEDTGKAQLLERLASAIDAAAKPTVSISSPSTSSPSSPSSPSTPSNGGDD